MLGEVNQALLDIACSAAWESNAGYGPGDTVHKFDELTIELSARPHWLVVALCGHERLTHKDWYEACARRAEGRSRLHVTDQAEIYQIHFRVKEPA